MRLNDRQVLELLHDLKEDQNNPTTRNITKAEYRRMSFINSAIDLVRMNIDIVPF